jgi:hypothetical protein
MPWFETVKKGPRIRSLQLPRKPWLTKHEFIKHQPTRSLSGEKEQKKGSLRLPVQDDGILPSTALKRNPQGLQWGQE